MSIPQTNRRQFLGGAAAAATWTILKPSLVRGSEANSKVAYGLVGCGGRGCWIAELFKQHGGYQLAATHDYFAEKANQAGDKHQVPAENRFDKLSGYKKLLETKLDAIVIESPPFFHPEQAAAGVDAGKHVFVAKPIAVDVPGCQSIGESGRQASQRKLAFLIDFQTRADPFYQEALKRVHAGALGRFVFGESTYHAGIPWPAHAILLAKAPDNPETRLAAWGLDRVLSGDIITEQNIHTLDVMNWIMQKPPRRAWGTCGKSGREDPGTCNDHFVLTYDYGDGVAVAFSSRQFDGHGTQPEGIRNRMFGADGVLETQYGGNVMIRGKNVYRGGKSPNIYRDGAAANIARFHQQITEGPLENATVEPSVQSTLITIMGRTAAYTGNVVTWDQTLASTEKLDGRLEGLKA